MTPAVALIAGGLSGIPAKLVATRLIEDRVDDLPESRVISGRSASIIWIVVSAAGWLALTLASGAAGSAGLAYNIAMFEIVVCISAVDGVIKKIPNELLLSLLLVFLAGRLANGGLTGIRSNIFGALLAGVVFLVPSLIGLNIGWGDVKYAFLLGLCFGLLPFIEIMLVMAAGLGIYAAYLTITKRGNLKTRAPMGPYISLGVIAAMLFPVLQGI